MMEWTRGSSWNGTVDYHGQIGRFTGTKATATVYRVGTKWTGYAKVNGKDYAVDVFGWFKTATEARAAIGTLCKMQLEHDAKAEAESGFPAMRAAAIKAAREDDSAMHAPGLSSTARLETFRRVASEAHARLCFRAAGGIGFGDMWSAWRDAYRAERCALTQARMNARRETEAKRASETDSEHAARLSGQAMGRKDSGSGAPRESRIAHLAYLEACDDSPRRVAAFRRGYLEAFNGGMFNDAAQESA